VREPLTQLILKARQEAAPKSSTAPAAMSSPGPQAPKPPLPGLETVKYSSIQTGETPHSISMDRSGTARGHPVSPFEGSPWRESLESDARTR
jgi:hypothetical protein